jgi:hypothetical protein
MEEWKYSSTILFTSAIDEGEGSASRSGRFTCGERTSGTHWIGDWVGARAGLDAVKRKISCLCRESNPGCAARGPSLYRLNYLETPKPNRI